MARKKIAPYKFLYGLLGLFVALIAILSANYIIFLVTFFVPNGIQSFQYETHKEKFFKTHKAFSAKIMPQNFELIDSWETPPSMDVRMSLTQKYRIHSTRKHIVEQLTPRFKAYGIRTRELAKAKYNPTIGDYPYINPETESADNYEASWDLQISTPNSNFQMNNSDFGAIGVEITFFPGDMEETSFGTYRQKETLPTNTEYITVEWICQDKITLCSEITYGSK